MSCLSQQPRVGAVRKPGLVGLQGLVGHRGHCRAPPPGIQDTTAVALLLGEKERQAAGVGHRTAA